MSDKDLFDTKSDASDKEPAPVESCFIVGSYTEVHVTMQNTLIQKIARTQNKTKSYSNTVLHDEKIIASTIEQVICFKALTTYNSIQKAILADTKPFLWHEVSLNPECF